MYCFHPTVFGFLRSDRSASLLSVLLSLELELEPESDSFVRFRRLRALRLLRFSLRAFRRFFLRFRSSDRASSSHDFFVSFVRIGEMGYPAASCNVGACAAPISGISIDTLSFPLIASANFVVMSFTRSFAPTLSVLSSSSFNLHFMVPVSA